MTSSRGPLVGEKGLQRAGCLITQDEVGVVIGEEPVRQIRTSGRAFISEAAIGSLSQTRTAHKVILKPFPSSLMARRGRAVAFTFDFRGTGKSSCPNGSRWFTGTQLSESECSYIYQIITGFNKYIMKTEYTHRYIEGLLTLTTFQKYTNYTLK